LANARIRIARALVAALALALFALALFALALSSCSFRSGGAAAKPPVSATSATVIMDPADGAK
jgi:hypothetical protein